jgi:hypothetical protein
MYSGASGCSIHFSACPIVPGAASGAAWLGVIVPQLPCELPLPTRALLEHPHLAPGLEQVPGAGQADHPATDDQDVVALESITSFYAPRGHVAVSPATGSARRIGCSRR